VYQLGCSDNEGQGNLINVTFLVCHIVHLSESECLSETLDLMLQPITHYSLDDKRKMMIHLKNRPTLLESVLHKAVEVKFVLATIRSRVSDKHSLSLITDPPSCFTKGKCLANKNFLG
jgi:hypothetical protein